MPLLHLLAFCFGMADAFSESALRVVLPELVTAPQLPRAKALLQSGSQLCLPVGSVRALIFAWRAPPRSAWSCWQATFVGAGVLLLLTLPAMRRHQLKAPA